MDYRINHFQDTSKSKSWKFSSYPKFQKSIVLWKNSKAASFQMVVNSQMCIQPPCHSDMSSPRQSWWQRLWQLKGHEEQLRSPRHPGYILMMEKKKKLKLKGLFLQVPSLYFKSSSIKHWVLWLPHHFKTQMVQRASYRDFLKLYFTSMLITNLAERTTKCR